MTDLIDLLSVLALTPAGENRYRADNHAEAGGTVVFGGQLLAQSVVAAGRVDPAKEVKSLHTIFARGASKAAPLDVDVDVMHVGRAVGSATVTFRQGDRLCCRSMALLNRPDPDLIRHQPDPPDVGGPDDAPPSTHGGSWWEIRTAGGVDTSDPDTVGPAELNVWTRFPACPPGELGTSQALLAYASDGFLIGTAMRPHQGVGQSMAHVEISTTVLSHTLSFHDPFEASEWLLLAHEAPYAGRGRSYGRAHVFTEDGRHVASFVQENMVRDFPEGRAPAPDGRSAY